MFFRQREAIVKYFNDICKIDLPWVCVYIVHDEDAYVLQVCVPN